MTVPGQYNVAIEGLAECRIVVLGKVGEPTESLLIITGSMGAGKSSVLAEASDLLALRKIAHAAIDLDVFGLAWLPSGIPTDSLMYDNLRAAVGKLRSLGCP